MRQPWKAQVVDEAAATLEQALRVRAGDALPDVALVELGPGRVQRQFSFGHLIPARWRRRSPGSRCSGSSCRKYGFGSPLWNTSSFAEPDLERPSACPACRSRIAARSSRERPFAAPSARRNPKGPRWCPPCSRSPARRASGSRARCRRRPSLCMRHTPRARSRCASQSIPIPLSKNPQGAGARECAGAPGCRSRSASFLQRVPCALEQDPGEMKLGGGRVVEIGRRIEILSKNFPGFLQGTRFRGVYGEHRRRSGTEKNESLLGSGLSSCQTNDCIIAMPARELDEHRLVGGRKLGGEDFRASQIGFKQPFEEFRRLDMTFSLFAEKDEGGIQCQSAGGVFGGRVGEREAAAQRAAVADRRVRDVRRRLGKERRMSLYVWRFFDLRVSDERADAQAFRRGLYF